MTSKYYKLADTLQIEPLKTLAAQKFLDEVPKQCDDAKFAEILRVMSEPTAADDEILGLATTKLFIASSGIEIIHAAVQEASTSVGHKSLEAFVPRWPI